MNFKWLCLQWSTIQLWHLWLLSSFLSIWKEKLGKDKKQENLSSGFLCNSVGGGRMLVQESSFVWQPPKQSAAPSGHASSRPGKHPPKLEAAWGRERGEASRKASQKVRSGKVKRTRTLAQRQTLCLPFSHASLSRLVAMEFSER